MPMYHRPHTSTVQYGSQSFAQQYQFALLTAGRTPMANAVVEDLHHATPARILFPATPVAMELVALAGGEANTALGTGVEAVRCWMLGPDYEHSEVIVATNGITPVVIPGGPYLRCNYLEADAVGSTGVTEGNDVVMQVSPGGSELKRLVVGRNESSDGGLTVDRDFSLSIQSIGWGLTDQKQTDLAIGFLEVRASQTAPWLRFADSGVVLSDLHPAETADFLGTALGLEVKPRSDIRISGLAAATDVNMNARLIVRH